MNTATAKPAENGLSLVITTFNNAATLEACISSVPFADDILVLDSFSTDDTPRLAASLGARVVQEAFRGYGAQKQRAVELAKFQRVLLLDADEALSAELADEIAGVLQDDAPLLPCRLRREEWLYWRWPTAGTRLTDHLRLFDRNDIYFGDHPVHAAAQTRLSCRTLRGRLRHYGHADLAGQLERINVYTSGAADQHHGAAGALKVLFAPTAAFLREYLLRRQFLNGWAGFLAARMASLHAFLRHAKRLEQRRKPPH